MATDVRALMDNIRSCCDFQNKAVVHVGVGAGSLVACSAAARSVLAVDRDADAVRRLGETLREQGLLGRVIVFRGDFAAVRARADVVFLTFCLHAMPDPDAALRHARTLAPETVVVDPAPGSRWAWYRGEEARVERAWEAVGRFTVARDDTFMGAEQFHDYHELAARLQSLGEPALSRIADFKDRQGIAIQMPYRIATLR